MSAAGGTMVRADMLSANKGAPANENVFTEQNEEMLDKKVNIKLLMQGM